MMLQTPVLFIVFNRLDLTKRVFERIRQAEPAQLFIAADGSRPLKAGENQQCAELRAWLLGNISWNCEVKTLFRTQNLGCAEAVSQAITWFFSEVEQGIILEDDCLPHPSFFGFCEQLLHHHKHNPKVWSVGGSNFQHQRQRGQASYYYSQYATVWGWATWRRAWQYYDLYLSTLPQFKQNNTIAKVFTQEKLQQKWLKTFEEVHKKQHETWDYSLFFAQWQQGALAITPQKNLVSNIGFDSRAVHTTNPRAQKANLKTAEITQNLKHPKQLVAHRAADHYFETQGNQAQKLLRRIKYRIQLILGLKKMPPSQ